MKANDFNNINAFTAAHYYRPTTRMIEIDSGREVYNEPTTPHFYDGIELIYVLSGKGLFSINGIDYPFNAKCCAYLYPYHIHYLHSIEEPLDILYCRFSLWYLIYLSISRHFVELNAAMLSQLPPCCCLGPQSDIFESAFHELIAENKQQKQDYPSLLSACITRLVIYYERHACKIQTQPPKTNHTKITKALQYIQFNSRKDLNSFHVAKMFDMTVAQLNSGLRLLNGYNFSQNLHLSRIRNAVAMMPFEDLSTSFIALYVGYHSVSAFYKHFKIYREVTPDEYRETIYPTAQHHPGTNTTAEIWLYINENYRRNISIKTAARHLNISSSTIRNILAQNYNMTFSHLVSTLRIWTACAMLHATPLYISDIATYVGYQSLEHFGRHFKEETGTTPSEYRNSRADLL